MLLYWPVTHVPKTTLSLLRKGQSRTTLQYKLKAAKSPEDVVTIAKEYGHEFTVDKITELSEEELEGVAGGGCTNLNPMC
ncbi:Nif11-like leader peptide family natural product precursor [Synechococcus sp. MIT S9504]|uniref:Nif11-like leader peptide family natural product precursor n=1 Tax=Synechococcus sp. MIT S9504 TaxID=1801628 RepID=UPI0039C3D7D6